MLVKIEYILSKIIKKLHLRAIRNSTIHKTSKVCAGSQIVNVYLGKYSDVGYDCIIINATIGAFCSFGANIIIGGASHTLDWVSTSVVFNENKDHIKKKFSNHSFDLNIRTTIGSDVWIANNVLIKAGVTIGDGSVIGMGSVVTKDVGPYEIWAGNPAKLIRKRFADSMIHEMLATEWWNWTDTQISQHAKHFNNPSTFINEFNKLKLK